MNGSPSRAGVVGAQDCHGVPCRDEGRSGVNQAPDTRTQRGAASECGSGRHGDGYGDRG